jgi:hypothetical protein
MMNVHGFLFRPESGGRLLSRRRSKRHPCLSQAIGLLTLGSLRESALARNAEIAATARKTARKTLHRSQIVLGCANKLAQLALGKPAVLNDTE